MNIKSILLTLALLSNTYNTTHTMNSLLTLAGDVAVVASCFSLLMGQASVADHKQILKEASFTQWNMIYNDANAIRPYVPLLLPCGFLISAGIRTHTVVNSPVKGTFKAGISIPLNLALILGTYAFRICLAPECAGTWGKLGDSLLKYVKRQ